MTTAAMRPRSTWSAIRMMAGHERRLAWRSRVIGYTIACKPINNLINIDIVLFSIIHIL
jgi:hypothetical protein